MKPAILYLRVSSTEQIKGYGPDRQKNLGREYAARMGWQIEQEIADEGRSAFHGANRLEGAALHDFELEARNGLHKGKVLIVENIDRLSRQGAKAAAQLIWALNEHGVDVATYHDGFIYKAGNNGDMMELFSVIIKAQLAHEESANKSRRTKASWSKRHADIANGSKATMAGRAPAWLTIRDGQYHAIERRKEVLNEIYDLYIAGAGIYKIVQRLNDRKEPPWPIRKKDGAGGWYMPYVYRLLTNRAVLGEYITLEGECLATDYFPQVITAEKFARAQEVRNTKAKSGGRDYNRSYNLLSGLISCAVCGGTGCYEHKGSNAFTLYTDKSGNVRRYARKTYERLRCDKFRRKHGCDNASLFDYKVVEKTVLDELLPRLVDKPTGNPVINKLREKIAELGRQRDVDQTRLNNIIDAIADGGSKALIQRVVTLEAEIENHTQAIEHLQDQLAKEEAKPSTTDDLALVESLRAELTSEDEDIRTYARSRVNMTLRRLLHRIVLHPNDIFCIWPDEDTQWEFDNQGTMLGGEQILRVG